jgi:hypothetical protein
MIKLTGKQLLDAANAANDIKWLEASKDRCRAFTVPFEIGGYYRLESIDVPVPVEPILQELNARIGAARAALAAMGIELLPGEEVSNG